MKLCQISKALFATPRTADYVLAVKKRTYMAGPGVVEVGRLGGAGVVLPFHGRGVRIFRGPPILA